MKETPLGEADYCISGNNNGHAHTCTPFASPENDFRGMVARAADRTQTFSFTESHSKQLNRKIFR
jgi:hypothetical protein